MAPKRGRRSDRHVADLISFSAATGEIGHPGHTALHAERLTTVCRLLRESGARTVLDLGCGTGGLLERLLLEEQFTSIVGLDTSILALREAERLHTAGRSATHPRLRLVHGSFMTPDAALVGFDAAAMVETIEHIAPDQLESVERVVFTHWRPKLVVVSTPNCEYNVRLGLKEGEYRHPEHRFEWNRPRFRRWSAGVAERSGYFAEFREVGPRDPLLGCPTQMVVFRRVATTSTCPRATAPGLDPKAARE